MNLKFTEQYPEVGASFTLQVSSILFKGRSKFQEIQVIETNHFGKILIIDNFIMLTERDEFIYHEMIVHPSLYVHPNPGKILVIGGGDGGTVREILKHPEVRHVDLVDIDEMVSRVCLDFLPEVSAQLRSKKVRCQYRDGVEYVKTTQNKYDIIIIDSTDPIGVGEGLFTEEFYRGCYKSLKEDGILVNQAESPIYTPEWVRDISAKISSIFSNVFFYSANIPTYPSGYWLFGFASKTYLPKKDFRHDRYQKNNLKLKYYNNDIHLSAFSLPNYVRELIGNS